ncbi:MAG: hypothetical protein KDK99_05450 [Verrucomicrobiales bacterium]|nr:hypothetical protein [Verrucomicrobiales bacterium]
MTSLTPPRRWLAGWILACICAAAPAQAQVVAYEVEFIHRAGFNGDFFNGGYFIAPALGGEGTFVFTTLERGRRILETTHGTGSFFTGVTSSGKYQTVVSASASSSEGTVRASYLAFAEATRWITLTTPEAITRLKLATRLHGESIAALDEGGTTALDGSTGFLNFSEMRLTLDETLTKQINEAGLTTADAVTRATTRLKRRGYSTPATTSTDTAE